MSGVFSATVFSSTVYNTGSTPAPSGGRRHTRVVFDEPPKRRPQVREDEEELLFASIPMRYDARGLAVTREQ